MNNSQIIMSLTKKLPSDFKIWVDEHSKKQVVDALLSLGYKWCSGEELSCNLPPIVNHDEIALFIRNKRVSWDNNEGYFARQHEPEVTAEELMFITRRTL